MDDTTEDAIREGDPVLARGVLDSKRDDLAVVMFHDGLGKFLTHVRSTDLVPAELLAEVSRLRAERDALAAELDNGRHEYQPYPPSEHPLPPWCGVRNSLGGLCALYRDDPTHRTSRVVLAEHTQEQR